MKTADKMHGKTMFMYSATLPYMKNNVKVFDVIVANRFLCWEFWSIVDTQFWVDEEKTKLVVNNFNLLRYKHK